MNPHPKAQGKNTIGIVPRQPSKEIDPKYAFTSEEIIKMDDRTADYKLWNRFNDLIEGEYAKISNRYRKFLNIYDSTDEWKPYITYRVLSGTLPTLVKNIHDGKEQKNSASFIRTAIWSHFMCWKHTYSQYSRNEHSKVYGILQNNGVEVPDDVLSNTDVSWESIHNTMMGEFTST